jgi:transcriptional regulator with XRE-family HTH domain
MNDAMKRENGEETNGNGHRAAGEAAEAAAGDRTAARLKALRTKAGQDTEGLADQIGITAQWFEDLEREPGELENTLDMTQLRKLAILLHVGMGYLVDGKPIPDAVPNLPFLEVARRIRLHLEHAKDIGTLEETIGWDLSAFLKHPDAEGWDQRLPFFRAVCAALGLDYRGVLRYCESIRDEDGEAAG